VLQTCVSPETDATVERMFYLAQVISSDSVTNEFNKLHRTRSLCQVKSFQLDTISAMFLNTRALWFEI
jgi:hypothetical protein